MKCCIIDIINNASKNGHIQVLEWFKNSGYDLNFNYTDGGFTYASKYGHVQVLEWFKNSGYDLKYTGMAIYYASSYGNIQVLEWFKNSGYPFKYDEWAIIEASENGHVQVLEWFKNLGHKFKYNEYLISYISYYCKQNNFLKFYSNIIDIKKIIKWSSKIIFFKTIKFKTHNKYLKGYQKN